MTMSPQPLSPQQADDPNILQARASNPQSSIWVGASAGTGKTKVLTDRVLRLLLPDEQGRAGSLAHQILCLTFTKAAAREMALRINKTLGRWAIADDISLSADLTKLLGFTPTQETLKAARQLFARIVDAPGGMNIMTIHSFCQSVLGRFPLEAGLSPNFEVLDEHGSAQILKQAQHKTLQTAQADKTHPLQDALKTLGALVNDDQLSLLIKDTIKERRQFLSMIAETPDYDALYHKLCHALDISPDINKATLIPESLAQNVQALKAICEQALTGKAKTDLSHGQILADFLAANYNQRQALYEDYKSIFLTGKGTPRASAFTQHVTKAIPEAADIIARETQAILNLEDTIKALGLAQNTHALFVLCAEILNDFQAIKTQNNVLDFDDLILYTLKLLQTEGQAGWVMYKLDRGLHHILVDEAQDTNPEQWGIIKALSQEFFAGDSRAEELKRQRSVFVVGDEKQSIYSFQRASPQEFDNTRQHFITEAKASAYEMNEVDLNTSFRSVQAVLDSVDQVFAPEAIRAGLGLKPVSHISFRDGQSGSVEIWPLVTPKDCESDEAPEQPDAETSDLWNLPTRIESHTEPQFLLAERIANQIETWITAGEELPSRDRAIAPGDIMILMRTRVQNGFIGHLTKSLKAKNIPVGSADRITLLDHIGVQDLLALANFALLPTDDLSLACLLKSPLIGWDDDDLMAAALDREATLWDALNADSAHDTLCTYLNIFITQAGSLDPFAFLNMALHSPCPANTTSGMNAMIGRLGQDAIDPLQCFLDSALQFENSDIQTLQEFVHAVSSQSSSQKRDMEDAGNAVRIMTVHGSKGLQAPIVFLPDTTRHARALPGQTDHRLLWPSQTGLDMPLWSVSSKLDPDIFKDAYSTIEARMDEEYRRLLYVAMTRAEDRLYVCGYHGKKEPIEESWYHYVSQGVKTLKDVQVLDDGTLRYDTPQIAEPDRQSTSERAQDTGQIELPDWIDSPARQELANASISPSHLKDEEPPLSPLLSHDQSRFARGNFIHKILQFLPDVTADERESVLRSYMQSHANDFSDDQKTEITDEILKLLNEPSFQNFFSPESTAEVPVTGYTKDGRIIHGQIDRLWVTDNEIWIIDYKSNRPPPKDVASVPEAYLNQMQAYRDIMTDLYPDKTIHTALLWTYAPRLMIIP